MSDSAYKKTIVIGLDYAQFSGGITDMNRKMGLLEAEFKLAKEQAKNYGDETDQLTVKKEALSQMINLQTKIVDENKKAYDRAMSSGTATEKQVDSLDKKLLTARTTLEKLNGEYDNASKELEEYEKKNEEAGKAVEESEKKQRSFGDTIRGIASSLGLEVSPAIENFASKFDGVNEKLGAAIITLGVMAPMFYNASKSVSEYADNVLTMSSVTGLATDTLQKMDYASELLDVSTDQISGSMTKLIRSMANARDGNEDLQKTFARLGVRYKEGNGELRNVEETFYDVIDALGKVGNETERDAKSMDLFGKSARELNPLIEAGSGKFRELGAEAEATGYVMDKVALEKAGALDDSMRRLNNTSEALKNSLGMALVPILTDLFGALAKIPLPVLQSLITFVGTAAMFVVMVNAITRIASAGGAVLNFFSTFNFQASRTVIIVLAIVSALALLVVAIAALSGKSGEISRTMNSVNSITGGGARHYASGTDFSPGGMAWVGEHGPELVDLPTGSRVLTAQESKRTSSGDTYILQATIDAKNVKDWTDVVSFMQQSKQAVRAGRSKL